MVNRIVAILYLLFIGVTSLIFFGIALVIWTFTVLIDRRLLVLHLFTSFWASLYLWIMPAWKLRIEGRRQAAWRSNFVIVSNHQSQLDILVAFRLFIPFKWVSKAEVFNIPLIGWNMRLNRYIRLKRGDKAGIARMFADCEAALAQGNSVFIFPEGTRSTTGRMKPFKPGAFVLAKKMNLPILPVVISGTHAALPKHSLNFHGRQLLRLRVLDPVPAERVAALPVAELADELHRLIAAELLQMTAGTDV